MNEEQIGVWLGMCICQVRGDVNRVKRFAQGLLPIDTPFAHAGAVTGSPKLIGDLVEIILIVSKARRVRRFCTAHDGSGLHEIANLSQHWQRHVLAMRIEREHTVVHPAWSCEFAIVKCQDVNQRVGVDVIPVIAFGNLRVLMQK